MQPNNPLDPQNTQPVPPTPPVEPQPAPAPQPVAPAPAPQPVAPQPAPAAPVDPLAQAPQPAPGQVPPAMPGAPAPLGSAPGGPEAPKSGFLDKLKANKKLLIKVAIIVAVAIVLIVGVVVGARFLPSNPVTNFLTGTQGVSLEQYDSDGLDFTMDVPKEWKIDEDADSEYYKYVTFREPAAELKDESEAAKHTASISVTLNDNSSSDILQKEEDEYFDDVKKSIKAGIDAAEDRDEENPAKFEILSDEDTEINGHKAYKVKVKASNFENEKDQVGYGTFLYVYVSKDYQYNITLSAHEADKGFVDKMDAIVASFKSSL